MERLLACYSPSGDLVHWGTMRADQASCPAPTRWGERLGGRIDARQGRISMSFHLLSGALRVLPILRLMPVSNRAPFWRTLHPMIRRRGAGILRKSVVRGRANRNGRLAARVWTIELIDCRVLSS